MHPFDSAHANGKKLINFYIFSSCVTISVTELDSTEIYSINQMEITTNFILAISFYFSQ